jgi:hypothetical protein
MWLLSDGFYEVVPRFPKAIANFQPRHQKSFCSLSLSNRVPREGRSLQKVQRKSRKNGFSLLCFQTTRRGAPGFHRPPEYSRPRPAAPGFPHAPWLRRWSEAHHPAHSVQWAGETLPKIPHWEYFPLQIRCVGGAICDAGAR